VVKIYLDRVDKTYNKKKDITLGHWCQDHNYTHLKEFKKIVEKNDDLLIDKKIVSKLYSKYFPKLYNEISLFIKKKNKIKNIVYCKYISADFIQHFFLFHIYAKFIIRKKIYRLLKKKNFLVLFYKRKSLVSRDISEFRYSTFDFRFLCSYIIYLLKKKNSKIKIIFLNNEYHSIKKKKYVLKNYLTIIKNKILTRTLEIYGFSFFKLLLLNTFLLIKKPIKKNPKNFYFKYKLKKKISNKVVNYYSFDKEYEKILPLSLRRIRKPIFNSNNNGKIIITSGGPLLETQKNMEHINSHRVSGGVVFSQQHGANYDDISNSRPIIENSSDCFIGWGSKGHPEFREKKFINLPNPQLDIILKKKKNRTLFVEARIQNYYFRNSFNPLKNIYNTLIFLKNLNKNIFSEIWLKKPLRVFNTSSQNRVYNEFPNIKFTNEKPESFLKYSKLLILNAPSTLFYKGLVSEIPTIAILEGHNYFTDEAKKYYRELEKRNIVFYDSLKASKFLNNNYKNLEKWWFSHKTVNAKKIFADRYCKNNKEGSCIVEWLKYFYNLKKI